MREKFKNYTLWVLTRVTLWPLTLVYFAKFYYPLVKFNKALGFKRYRREALIDLKSLWDQGIVIEKNFLKTGGRIF